MSRLVLIHYEGKNNYGIVGSKTRFKVDEINICVGDVRRIMD